MDIDNSLDKLYDVYTDTINSCGIFLINESDDEIEYKIFEEFIIGVISFLHWKTLERLNLAGYISKGVEEKSISFRKKVLEIENTNEWNISSVRTSPMWREIMILSDDIRNRLNK